MADRQRISGCGALVRSAERTAPAIAMPVMRRFVVMFLSGWAELSGVLDDVVEECQEIRPAVDNSVFVDYTGEIEAVGKPKNLRFLA